MTKKPFWLCSAQYQDNAMDEKLMNVLTLQEYHLLTSEKTLKPYIDEKGACYLFYLRSDAEKFISDKSDIKIEDAKHFRMPFIAELYGYGIKAINVKQKGGDSALIPIEKGDVKREYTNQLASLSVALLKQTSKKKYMKALKGAVFLAPILIDPRLEKRYPEMHYSYATTNGEDKYYCLFTTIREFNSWNLEQEQEWKPVELPLYKIGRIRGHESVIINPLSDAIILTDKQLQEIMKG